MNESEGQKMNTQKEKKRLEKKEGIQLLTELLNEKKNLKSQEEIRSALEKKDYTAEQSSISRWLGEIAEKKGGCWGLKPRTQLEESLEIFKKKVSASGVFSSYLQNELKTALFKTQPFSNREIAEMMKQAFKDEILSIFCPNDEDIVVFFHNGFDDFGKEREESRFLEEIKKISTENGFDDSGKEREESRLSEKIKKISTKLNEWQTRKGDKTDCSE
jgi:arginine repressor